MKISYEKLIASSSVIDKLCEQDYLEVEDMLTLSRLLEQVDTEKKHFEFAKQKMFSMFGTEKDGSIVVDPESEGFSEFTTQLTKLFETEVELFFEPISIDFIKRNKLKMSPKDLMQIKFLFSDS